MTTHDEAQWAPLMEAAAKAARSVARKNFELDRQDIEQEILLWATANYDTLTDKAPGVLFTLFRRVGGAYAEKERRQAIVNSGQYIYTPAVVKKVLAEVYYDQSAREQMPTREDQHSTGDTCSPVIAIWDIDQALQRISAAHGTAIRRRYLLGEDMRGPAERKALSRGLEALTWQLNYRLVDQARDSRRAVAYNVE